MDQSIPFIVISSSKDTPINIQRKRHKTDERALLVIRKTGNNLYSLFFTCSFWNTIQSLKIKQRVILIKMDDGKISLYHNI